MERGVENTKKEIVLNMYQEDYPFEAIAKITNLSLEQVRHMIETE